MMKYLSYAEKLREKTDESVPNQNLFSDSRRGDTSVRISIALQTSHMVIPIEFIICQINDTFSIR